MEIHALELPKLPLEHDHSTLWKWLAFLKAKNDEEFNRLAGENKTIGKAVRMLRELSEEERAEMIEIARYKALWREHSMMEVGKTEALNQTAQKAIRMGLPMESIAELTELPETQIRILMEARGAYPGSP